LAYQTEISEDRRSDKCDCWGFFFRGRCGHIEIKRAMLGWKFNLELAIRYLKKKWRDFGKNGQKRY
jgi:hypothetical protein